MLLAKPHQRTFQIALDGIGSGIFSRRIVDCHLYSLVVDFHQLAGAVQADPHVAFGIHAAFARHWIFHEDRELVDLSGLRIDAAHLIDRVLDEPNLVVARYRHTIGIRGAAPLDAGRHFEDGKFFRGRVQSDDLVRGDGIQPDAAVRMHAHRVAAGGAVF